MSDVIGIGRTQKEGENGLAWRGWPCLHQVEHGEALAVLGHERNRVVGHFGVTVRWWCGWWVGGRWGGGERERAAAGAAHEDEGRPRKERMGRAGVVRVAMRTPR